MCEAQRFTQKSRTGEGFALCRSDFSVAYGEENMNRHKDTSKHKGYVDTAQPQNKKLTNFGASLATANLDQKVVKAKLLFFWFSG